MEIAADVERMVGLALPKQATWEAPRREVGRDPLRGRALPRPG